MHGEEIALVAEFADQIEFLLDLHVHGFGDCSGPAHGGRGRSDCAQMGIGAEARRHQLAWVLIAQLIELERAAIGDV